MPRQGVAKEYAERRAAGDEGKNDKGNLQCTHDRAPPVVTAVLAENHQKTSGRPGLSGSHTEPAFSLGNLAPIQVRDKDHAAPEHSWSREGVR
jgi:hypothetical protein